MDRLGAADQRRLIAFNHESQETALDPGAVTEFILRSVSSLVPSECVVHRLNDDAVGPMITTVTVREVQESQDAGRDLWLSIVARSENPVVAHWNRSGDHRSVRVSDVIGLPTLHRLEMYDHFWRPFAIERAMAVRVQISSRYLIDLACYRTGRDFSERDLAVLDGMSFSMALLARRANVRGLVDASVGVLGLTGREAEIIAWLAHGKTNAEIGDILYLAQGTVRKHVDNIYRKLAIRTRMEAAALALTASWGADAPLRTAEPGDPWRTVLGLTRREAEVLALAVRGKTNAEIGAILLRSPGTAKRHLENIYRKLEVNTRTEAAALAWSTFDRLSLPGHDAIGRRVATS
jgi:DNA-binding CsgD family transcriptional regulator